MNADFWRFMVKQSYRIVLITALLFSQFGCASLPRTTQPAVIHDDAPWAIRPVDDLSTDPRVFRDKIAELKGNLLKFHAADTAYTVLSRAIDQLDGEQVGTARNHYRSHKNAAGIGILAGATIVGVLIATEDRSKNSHALPLEFELGGILPLGMAAGSLAALLVSGAITGPDVTPDRMCRLNILILDYNHTLEATKARDSGATKQ